MRSASLASLYRMPAGHLPGCPASWPLNPLARDLLLIGGFAALTHVMRQRVARGQLDLPRHCPAAVPRMRLTGSCEDRRLGVSARRLGGGSALAPAAARSDRRPHQ